MQVVRKFEGLHEGGVSCLEGGHSGRMLFTGASDGLVLAHDLRMKDPSMVLWHHNAAGTPTPPPAHPGFGSHQL